MADMTVALVADKAVVEEWGVVGNLVLIGRTG